MNAMNRDPQRILDELCRRGLISNGGMELRRLSGTTEGVVYAFADDKNAYILKCDDPLQIGLTGRFLQTYRQSPLLPEVLHTAPDDSYIVYAFIPGTTHINRGTKREWLSKVVTDLLNHYIAVERPSAWGRIEHPRRSWYEFNQTSIDYIRTEIGALLSDEDYRLVDGLVGKLFNGAEAMVAMEATGIVEAAATVATTEATEAVGIMEATATTEPQRAYLLHGDTGVHNFVFHDRALVGVIDPSPVIGPILYDFLYAFCSSPDDLSAETLLGAYRLLRNKPVDERRLIEEAAVQLYCRIGICLMHHPQDRDAYLDAWAHWKTLLPEAGK